MGMFVVENIIIEGRRSDFYFYFVREVSGGSFGAYRVRVWEEMEWQGSSQALG
jgi:hypothetical protein